MAQGERMARRTATSAPSATVAGGGEGVGEAPDHDIRAVLQIPTFRRLWLALTFSSFGDWLGLLATMSMAVALSPPGSTAKAGAAVSVTLIMRLLPSLVLGPVAGALADRFDRRWTMVTGDLVRFVLFCSIPLVGTLTWMYAATLLIECAALVWGPAKEATVPNLVPRRRLEAANQISLAATYGTAPIAALAYSGLALLTGVLDNFVTSLQANPVDLALYVDALSFLVSALTISRLTLPRRTGARLQQDGPPPLWRSMLEGWRFVGGTPVVRGLVLGMLGAFAAAGLVIGPAQQFVRSLRAGDPGYGLLFGSVFVGLAAGMWLGPRFLPGLSRRRLFGLSLASAGVLLTGLALIPNIVIATLLTMGIGAFGGLAWVTGYTLLGLVVDDEVRGRTFGFLQAAARVVLVLVLAVAPPLAGIIGDHTVRFTPKVALTYSGAAVVYLVAGIVAVVLGAAAFRQMDDRRGIPLTRDLVTAWRARFATSGPAASPGRPVAAGRGVFLAFEGGDGAGKSTQAGLLAQWLESECLHDVVLTREPGGSEVGTALRALLLERTDLDARAEALIFAADRAQHVSTVVQPALAAGAVVVSDRFVDSSVAYQGAGQALDVDEVERLSGWATRSLLPDLTILLDAPAELARARREADGRRAGEDRIEAGDLDFHERVRAHFLALAARAPHRYLVLDAALPAEDLQLAIRAAVGAMLPVSPRRRQQLVDEADAVPRGAIGVGTGHDPEPEVDDDAHATSADVAGQALPHRHRAREAAEHAEGHNPETAHSQQPRPARPEELLTVPIPLALPEMARPFVPTSLEVPIAPPAPAPGSVPVDGGYVDGGYVDGGYVDAAPLDAAPRRPGPRRLLREQEQRARLAELAAAGQLPPEDHTPPGLSPLDQPWVQQDALPAPVPPVPPVPTRQAPTAQAPGQEPPQAPTAQALAEHLRGEQPSAERPWAQQAPVGQTPPGLPLGPGPVVRGLAEGHWVEQVAPHEAPVEPPAQDPTLVLGHAGAIDLRVLRDLALPGEDVNGAAHQPSADQPQARRNQAEVDVTDGADLGDELFHRFGQ